MQYLFVIVTYREWRLDERREGIERVKKNFEKFVIDITRFVGLEEYFRIYIYIKKRNNICKQYVLCKINVGYKNIIFYFSNRFVFFFITKCINVKNVKGETCLLMKFLDNKIHDNITIVKNYLSLTSRVNSL